MFSPIGDSLRLGFIEPERFRDANGDGMGLRLSVGTREEGSAERDRVRRCGAEVEGGGVGGGREEGIKESETSPSSISCGGDGGLGRRW